MAKKAIVLSGGGARGAYQAGVWKYLQEKKWKPDIICGTSVGAINACAIGSGMSAERIIELWLDLNKKNVMRMTWKSSVLSLFKKNSFAFVDTSPLRDLLFEKLDFQALNASDQKVVITAVNILNAELAFFENPELRIEHILASSAIPLLFPWQLIGGVPHWDGGVMANTPILPAISKGAEEIIVVLLSPVGGEISMSPPKNKIEALERMYELYLIASYKNIQQGIELEKEATEKKSSIELFLNSLRPSLSNIDIKVVSPKRLLGLGSFLNFNKKQSEELIDLGYRDAQETL